jgi:uridine kinase
VIDALAAALPPTSRVGVDGPDAAGKTTFADALAAELARLGHAPARLSVDAFLRPREERYRQGPLSPDGYFEDSFDLEAFAAAVAAAAPPVVADGVFLQRPELAPLWSFVVYLDCTPDETLRRALVRDPARFGSRHAVVEQYTERYLPAQARYREVIRPHERADLVLAS